MSKLKDDIINNGGEPTRRRVVLFPALEKRFQEWFKTDPNVVAWAKSFPNGVVDPDDPLNKFDYRKAWLDGDYPQINPEDSLYHWGSSGKDPDHPTYYKQFQEPIPDWIK